MKALIIKEDESTPNIVFDKENKQFEISGNSLPEDVLSFYKPVFKWIGEYITQPNPTTTLKFKPNYINSASSKIFLELLYAFEELVNKGLEVTVEWHYLQLDDDMLMSGKEFESLLKIPFVYIAYQD